MSHMPNYLRFCTPQTQNPEETKRRRGVRRAAKTNTTAEVVYSSIPITAEGHRVMVPSARKARSHGKRPEPRQIELLFKEHVFTEYNEATREPPMPMSNTEPPIGLQWPSPLGPQVPQLFKNPSLNEEVQRHEYYQPYGQWGLQAPVEAPFAESSHNAQHLHSTAMWFHNATMSPPIAPFLQMPPPPTYEQFPLVPDVELTAMSFRGPSAVDEAYFNAYGVQPYSFAQALTPTPATPQELSPVDVQARPMPLMLQEPAQMIHAQPPPVLMERQKSPQLEAQTPPVLRATHTPPPVMEQKKTQNLAQPSPQGRAQTASPVLSREPPADMGSTTTDEGAPREQGIYIGYDNDDEYDGDCDNDGDYENDGDCEYVEDDDSDYIE